MPASAIATLIELALQSNDPRLIITAVLASNEWLRAQELLHVLQHIDPAILKEAHEQAAACAELQRQQLH